MSSSPLVSVIITCFNHAPYVEEAVNSVLSQNYDTIEIILVDDASTDNSQEIINQLQQNTPAIKTVFNSQNCGVCVSFNKGFSISKGDFIIDLAADDCLLPNKITSQLNKLQSLPNDYGVVYSDLIFVDENGSELVDYTIHKTFFEGDVFSNVVAKHCIYACTMLVKREVFDDLKGYDESLAYEDFDFFIRASRNWKFACVRTPLMAKRELNNSLGKQFFKGENRMGDSTLKVCQKVKQLIRNTDEKKALNQRIYYEAYDAFRHGQFRLALKFLFV